MARTIFVALLAVTALGAADAQRSILIGSVTSDSAGKHPVANAMVAVSVPQRSVRADSSGSYRIDGLSQGRVVVVVRAIGYAAINDTIMIDSDDATLHNFVLARQIVELATVVSTATKVQYNSPMLRGFEDRRAEGSGHFISEAILRGKDNERLSDIIRAYAPGLQLIQSRGETYAASSRNSKTGATVMPLPGQKRPKGPPACYATIYLDGVLLYDVSLSDSSMTPPNLAVINLNQLAGVEYYGGEATAPPGYRQSGCGLLLLWTREKQAQ
jgi:hypothetical protein